MFGSDSDTDTEQKHAVSGFFLSWKTNKKHGYSFSIPVLYGEHMMIGRDRFFFLMISSFNKPHLTPLHWMILLMSFPQKHPCDDFGRLIAFRPWKIVKNDYCRYDYMIRFFAVFYSKLSATIWASNNRWVAYLSVAYLSVTSASKVVCFAWAFKLSQQTCFIAWQIRRSITVTLGSAPVCKIDASATVGLVNDWWRTQKVCLEGMRYPLSKPRHYSDLAICWSPENLWGVIYHCQRIVSSGWVDDCLNSWNSNSIV